MDPSAMEVQEENEPEAGHSDKRRRLITGAAEQVETTAPEVEDGIETHLPVSRVKDIMQTASDGKVQKDAVKLMCAATELFLQELARKTFSNATAMKKKTLTSNDLMDVCNRHSNLHFLPDSKVLKTVSPHKRVIRSQETPALQPSDLEVMDAQDSE